MSSRSKKINRPAGGREAADSLRTFRRSLHSAGDVRRGLSRARRVIPPSQMPRVVAELCRVPVYATAMAGDPFPSELRKIRSPLGAAYPTDQRSYSEPATSFGRTWIKSSDHRPFPTDPGCFAALISRYSGRYGSGFMQRSSEAAGCYRTLNYFACCAAELRPNQCCSPWRLQRREATRNGFSLSLRQSHEASAVLFGRHRGEFIGALTMRRSRRVMLGACG